MEIAELKNTCVKIFELMGEIEDLDTEKKKINGKITELKKKALVELEKNELKNFDSGVGKISRIERRSVKIEDKYVFMDWLDNKGELREYLTVSAATAKKIYEEEFENAKENKNLDFLKDGIPGLSQPSIFVDIRMTKRKLQ